MKGIILAGGFGNRLKPLTNIINKHLLPVYDRPVIFYPLQTLLDSGITDILIVTGPEYAGGFMKLLGSGERYGCNLYFAVQEKPSGIAHAILSAERFVGNDSITVILGDNIFEDDFSASISSFDAGAMIFLKDVHDPERFGVVALDEANRVIDVVEKPSVPPSQYAVTGLYVYDHQVFKIIKSLTPSARGELEITDVNRAYLKQTQLNATFIQGRWTDAGTFESLYEASTIARNIALKKSSSHV